MQKKRLLVYGDIDIDIIVKTDSSSAVDEDGKVEEALFSPGGSAANCAAIASRLGLPTTFLGAISRDHWSRLLVKDLHKYNVTTKYMQKVDGPTPICVSIVDNQGGRKFYSYRGVNQLFPLKSIPPPLLETNHCLHLSGYSFQDPDSHLTAVHIIQEARDNGLLVSLDPSFLFSKQLDIKNNEILSGLDFFYPNNEEAYQLTRHRDPLKAARVIREYGPKVVIVTLGKDGCLVLGEGIQEFVSLGSIEGVVDTTGAGDAFCGGFLMAVLNGLPLVQACKVGSATSAHLITRLGGHEHAPFLPDIQQILREYHEDELTKILEKL
jgi:ribokinase